MVWLHSSFALGFGPGIQTGNGYASENVSLFVRARRSDNRRCPKVGISLERPNAQKGTGWPNIASRGPARWVHLLKNLSGLSPRRVRDLASDLSSHDDPVCLLG